MLSTVILTKFTVMLLLTSIHLSNLVPSLPTSFTRLIRIYGICRKYFPNQSGLQREDNNTIAYCGVSAIELVQSDLS